MQAELIPVHVCSNRNRYPDLGRTEHHYPSQSHVEEALLPRGGSHTKSICMVRGDELTVVKLSRDVADPVSVRAMTMLIEQFNQRELLTLAAGGHTLEETRRMVTAGYWHQMTSHSAAMIRPTDGAVVCAAVCIPFTPLRVHVVKRIVTALRGGCMDDLADLPQGLVQYVCADRHPEVLWFLAECDEAVSNLAQLGDGPQRSMASKLAAYSVQSGGGCTLVEEIALIASAPDSPRGAMTSLVSHILKDMWTDGVRMAIGHYSNLSVGLAVRTGGVELASVKYCDSEALKRYPGEPPDSDRIEKHIKTPVPTGRQGPPAEFFVAHDLDYLSARYDWHSHR
ncbi:unnamed protein product (mitochondrion) [Plasmodiophora brassicae]|uniref:Uncharacterized protein n=1 Tax=Plasmodiophora brassicae TaxID=37360 RepID=A0A0G4IGW5_PLABS|nr:hypothetical protein PBRA_000223 [Plasmodiophora brassicae]SPQ96784.1 unnamed protein product [Plasmodiophora brassicae]